MTCKWTKAGKLCTSIYKDTNKALKNYSTNNGTEFESGRSAQVEVRGYSDITGDNIVYKYTIELINQTADQIKRVDVSGDGKVKSIDAILILMRTVYADLVFPVEK